jgi:YTH domain-containing family protein
MDHGLIEMICDSDSFACCLNQEGAVTSQPLSVAIPPERSITPVLQDFMDPNLFYLPAYYYGGEELMVIRS